jgi:hypothetical protein
MSTMVIDDAWARRGGFGSGIVFGFISYMFVYALYLIRLLEQPFAKGHASVDDVSFFLLDELETHLRRTLDALNQRSTLEV